MKRLPESADPWPSRKAVKPNDWDGTSSGGKWIWQPESSSWHGHWPDYKGQEAAWTWEDDQQQDHKSWRGWWDDKSSWNGSWNDESSWWEPESKDEKNNDDWTYQQDLQKQQKEQEAGANWELYMSSKARWDEDVKEFDEQHGGAVEEPRPSACQPPVMYRRGGQRRALLKPSMELKALSQSVRHQVLIKNMNREPGAS